MTFKQNVVKDLLCVIAYGTAISRSSAAKLLFYYWPAFNANLFDRKGLLSKLTSMFRGKFIRMMTLKNHKFHCRRYDTIHMPTRQLSQCW